MILIPCDYGCCCATRAGAGMGTLTLSVSLYRNHTNPSSAEREQDKHILPDPRLLPILVTFHLCTSHSTCTRTFTTMRSTTRDKCMELIYNALALDSGVPRVVFVTSAQSPYFAGQTWAVAIVITFINIPTMCLPRYASSASRTALAPGLNLNLPLQARLSYNCILCIRGSSSVCIHLDRTF